MATPAPEPDPTVLWLAVGIAYPVGFLPHWRGPVATFRLAIGKQEVPGRWVCHRRRFVPAESWEAL
jgi:hypothetical protein